MNEEIRANVDTLKNSLDTVAIIEQLQGIIDYAVDNINPSLPVNDDNLVWYNDIIACEKCIEIINAIKVIKGV